MTETTTQSETDISLTVPTLWNVRILNDDFTPIDFVISILMQVFKKAEREAMTMTLQVHEEGSAIVGTYTKEVAYAKCQRATMIAEDQGHPLQLVPESSV